MEIIQRIIGAGVFAMFMCIFGIGQVVSSIILAMNDAEGWDVLLAFVIPGYGLIQVIGMML